MSRRCVVLGGGVAGLCAAFELLDAGHRVELIEGHGQLGGRAFTVPDRFGVPADNGPHVILGAYRELRRLLRRLGTEHRFDAPRSLRLAYAVRGGRVSRLVLPPGPPALTLPIALARFGGMSVVERFATVRGLGAVMLGAHRGEDLESWIARHGQRGGPRRFLWDPMCRAIMNAEASAVDAGLFLATLREAFLGSGAAAAIWAPAAGWSDLLGEPAERRLIAAGATLRLRTRVAGLDVAQGRVVAVRLADGDAVSIAPSDLVVSALPWHAFDRVLPGRLLAPLPASSPIVSVYFRFDTAPTLPPDPVLSLVDGQSFDFVVRRPGDDLRNLALLSGGGRGLDGLAASAIAQRARTDLRTHFPDATPILDTGLARVTKESRATFIAAPGAESHRPPPGPIDGIDNLRICGDWTATGLPATLEGAARSAITALTHPPVIPIER